jgi:antitoxin HicB
MKPIYPARFELQSEGGYLVQFIDLPEVMTEGATLEEAELNAQEALSGILEYRLDENQEIPYPAVIAEENVRYISPDAQIQAALLVRKQRGVMPLSTLARALETSWPAAQRLENPHHWPTLKQLDRTARALGKRLVISME